MKNFVLVLLLVCFVSPFAFAQAITDPPVVTPVMEKTTLNKMIDEEAKKLPFLKRKIVQRLLADDSEREKLVERVALKLAENKKLKSMSATFEAEDFSGDTTMAISPELKQMIGEILKQILPILLQLIFKV